MAIAPLAGTAEFLPYLESAEKSGERTRRVMYVLILVLVFLLCATRGYIWSDWPEQRIRVAVQANTCLANVQAHLKNDKIPVSDICVKILKHFIPDTPLPLDVLTFLLKDSCFVDVYRLTKGDGKPTAATDRCLVVLRNHARSQKAPQLPQEIIAYISGSAETNVDNDQFTTSKDLGNRIRSLMRVQVQSRAFQLPLFGAVIDGNDLWVISGVISTTLLFVLLVHMQRELQNLLVAKQVCPNDHCRNLLVMSHIFATPMKTGHTGRLWRTDLFERILRQSVFFVIYFSPFFIHVWIALSDIIEYDSYEWSAIMLGRMWARLDNIVEAFFAAILLPLGWRCYVYGRRIDREVNEIYNQIDH